MTGVSRFGGTIGDAVLGRSPGLPPARDRLNHILPIMTPRTPDERRARKSRTGHGILPSLLGYNLRRAQLRVFQHFQSSMTAFEVTPGQFGVLTLIAENDGLKQSELGAALGIDRSTMVTVIDRLESRGLVVRAPSPSDRRSYALRLSEAGERLMGELTPKVREHEAAIAASLSAAERRQLISLLQRIGK